jgi:hypothetical protein
MDLVNQIKEMLPKGHGIVIAAYWCRDSLNHVPHMAKIAEVLDAWTWEMYPRENLEIVQKWKIRKIPQMILLNPDTLEEWGRIIENPQSGSIEQDMINILQDNLKRD